jgi:hypothetical protein
MQLGTNRIVVVDRWRSVERLFVTEGSRLANPNLKIAAGTGWLKHPLGPWARGRAAGRKCTFSGTE